MWPAPRSRRYGSAAWVTHSAPNRLVSIWSRASSSDASSIIPKWPKPALFTTMSSSPKWSCACRTAAKQAARSVTSSGKARKVSGYFAARSSVVPVLRAVPTTRSPRTRAAAAHSRPKPRDVPVMNHVLAIAGLLDCRPKVLLLGVGEVGDDGFGRGLGRSRVLAGDEVAVDADRRGEGGAALEVGAVLAQAG